MENEEYYKNVRFNLHDFVLKKKKYFKSFVRYISNSSWN